MKAIRQFQEEYRFLSNFYPVLIDYDGLIFRSTEAAYQAAKTFDFEDRKKISEMEAGASKRAGQKVVLRSDWGKVKFQIMYELCKQKFSKPKFKQLLLDTGDLPLIEGNFWHDNTFGHCYCPNCKDKEHRNELGKILMRIREELRNG